MADLIDREARRHVAHELTQILSSDDAVSRMEALGVPGTKDKAVRAVLKEVCYDMETAAARLPRDCDFRHTALQFTDDEKKRLDYLILFLESDAALPGYSMPLRGRTLWIALGSYSALLLGFTL